MPAHSTGNKVQSAVVAGLLTCIKALWKEEDREEPESQSATCTWVNEVDRGGLWHV